LRSARPQVHLGIELRATGIFELKFLGTRGEIKIRSRRHWRHSALLIRHNDARIMIDCGADWLHQLSAVAPTAIVLTHAHPDHAWGLAEGAPCPVYATRQTSALLRGLPVHDWRLMPLGRPMVIGGVTFKAYAVQHSIRAPAVGYRVSARGSSFFYLPDVAWLPNASVALRGIDIYIGDRATIVRPLVRKRGGTLIGHAAMATQLRWCQEAHVQRAVFTHCGSQVVGGGARRLNGVLRRLGRQHDVDARLACDGNRLSPAHDFPVRLRQPRR
jgi:phosphoribosyl 1,2-cyclic phosphodiesterase